MTRRFNTVLLIVFGSFFVHCGDSALHTLVDAGKTTRDASAQERPCGRWEVRTVVPPSTQRVDVNETGGSPTDAWVFDSLRLDEGWEPFGGQFGRAPTIALRRCLD